jgi:hypothetical protein
MMGQQEYIIRTVTHDLRLRALRGATLTVSLRMQDIRDTLSVTLKSTFVPLRRPLKRYRRQ